MTRCKRNALILVAAVAALATATVAAAPTRADTDGARGGKDAGVGRPGPGRAVTTTSPRAARPPGPRAGGPFAREIAEASARYGVPERLVWAVIRVESGFDHRAVSRRGARGLMQLMPETAALLGVRDPFDPRQNIHAGTRHLRGLMVRFDDDVRLAVAAYNAGVGPVVQHRGVPPYPETRRFVRRVLRLYARPGEPVELRRDGVRRIVRPGGRVVYTNLAFGGLGAAER